MEQRRVTDDDERHEGGMKASTGDEKRLNNEDGAGDREEEEQENEEEDRDAYVAEVKGEAARATQQRKLEEKGGVGETKDAGGDQRQFAGATMLIGVALRGGGADADVNAGEKRQPRQPSGARRGR